MRPVLIVVFSSLLLTACDRDGSPVETGQGGELKLAYVSGIQFGTPGQTIEPVTVTVRNTKSQPVAGMRVMWSVVQDRESRVTTSQAITNDLGEASTALVLGGSPGTVVVRAAAESGDRVDISIRSVYGPQVAEISPASVRPGETLTIRGHNFSATSTDNRVRIGNVMAVVTSAQNTQLRVTVPECVAAGAQSVSVHMGTVPGNVRTVNITRPINNPFELAVGQSTKLSSAQLKCVQMPAGEYLVLLQNATASWFTKLPIEMAIAHTSASALNARFAAAPDVSVERDIALELEAKLRAREHNVPMLPTAVPSQQQLSLRPRLGDTRRFNAGWLNDSPVWVNAMLRGMSGKAMVYVDSESAEMFTESQVNELLDMYDNVIYPANVALFGEPSDVDVNGRVVLLFTPAVNRLTPAGSSSTLTGFTSSCDIEQCRNTNVGEIVYLLVPDSEGKYGKTLKADSIFRSIPRTIAHELVHVIHFTQRFTVKRAQLNEESWLAEGLAHQAEELISELFAARGRHDVADSFRDQNRKRAMLFLENAGATGLIASNNTVTERGAQWMFVNYLNQRFGPSVLKRLAQTTHRGTGNVAQATGVEWSSLLADWAMRVYAAGTGESTFIGNGDFPANMTEAALQPLQMNVQKPVLPQTIAAGGTQFIIVDTRMAPTANLSVTDVNGRAPSLDAQLVIRRLR